MFFIFSPSVRSPDHHVVVPNILRSRGVSLLPCYRLSVSGGLKKRAGDEWGVVIPLAADPACRPLAFSIVLTDREPRTGYFSLDAEIKTRLRDLGD